MLGNTLKLAEYFLSISNIRDICVMAEKKINGAIAEP